MARTYDRETVKEGIKKFNASLRPIKGESNAMNLITPYSQEKICVGDDWISEGDVKKVEKIIHGDTGKPIPYIHQTITGESEGLERLANSIITILSIGLVIFTLARANITGAVIGTSNSTANIGIIICILGIIGLLIYKFRKR